MIKADAKTSNSSTEIFIPLNKLKKSPKNARKMPHTKQSENAPDYRILVNKFEVGAAWLRTSNDKQFLSVKLDDPFAAPVFANLIEAENKSYQLIWSRRSAD